MAPRAALVLAAVLGAAPELGRGGACGPGGGACASAAEEAGTDEVGLLHLRAAEAPAEGAAGALRPSGLSPPAEDTDSGCAGWAAAGQCASNPTYMLAGCARSCARAGEDSGCAGWAAAGECASNPTYMLAACSWSCARAEDKDALLQKHNVFRCMHGVPALEWDDAVAASAQAWADRGIYDHSETEYGENIAWGSPTQSAAAAVANWYSEVDLTAPRGLVKDWTYAVGHYTQVVWKGTAKLGCGKGRAQEDGSLGDLWVCQYSPSGNMRGNFGQNVLAPSKTEGQCGGTGA